MKGLRKTYGAFRGAVSPSVRSLVQQGSNMNYLHLLQQSDSVWFDFFDLASQTRNGSNIISNIKDKYNASRSISSAALSTLNGASFDGVAQYLRGQFALNGSQPLTMYAVVKQISWKQAMCLWDGYSISRCILMQNGTSPGLKANAGAYSSENRNLAVGSWGIIRVVYNSANSKLQINKTAAITGNFGTDIQDGLTLGTQTIGSGYSNILVKGVLMRPINELPLNEDKIYNGLENRYLNRNIIAIAGASNTIGYYPEDSVLPASYAGDQGRIFIRFDPITGANFEWMNPAKNSGYDWIANPQDNTGWALEQSLSHRLVDRTDSNVFVVKSGVNGGVIADFDAGTSYYNNLEAGLIAALNDTNYNSVGKLAFIFGSPASDAVNNVSTEYVEGKLNSLISRLRAADARLTNMQVVIVKMFTQMTAYGLDTVKIGKVNQAYDNVANSVSNVVCVHPDNIAGVTLRADQIHYNSATQLLIGNAVCDAIN